MHTDRHTVRHAARAVAASLLSLSGLVLVVPAAHADVTDLTFSPTTPAAGTTITVTGAGCAPGEDVLVITWLPTGGPGDEISASGTANGSGSFSIPVMLADNERTEPGVQFGVAVFCGGVRQYDDPSRNGTTFGRFGEDSATPENRRPVAVADSYTIDAGETLTVAAPGVLANDSDPDGDGLTAVLFVAPGHGSATIGWDGSLSYTPADGFSGTDTIVYRAYDGDLQSDNATIRVVVRPADESGGDAGGGMPGDDEESTSGSDDDVISGSSSHSAERDGVLPRTGGVPAVVGALALGLFVAGATLLARGRRAG